MRSVAASRSVSMDRLGLASLGHRGDQDLVALHHVVHDRHRRPVVSAVVAEDCCGCGKCAPGYDQREARQWWHLNLGATRIWLRYAPRRVECARCGVVNEQVPWGSAAGWFSATFEETTAYLARVADKTS